MMERVVVDKDVLEHRGLEFQVINRIKYECEEEDAFIVQLRKGDKRVGWLQGWQDLSYDYMREYERQLEAMK